MIKAGYFLNEWNDKQRDEYDFLNETILKNKEKIDILLYGDSITRAWNLKIKNKQIINRAIDGDRTRYMLYRFDADCIQLKPNKIFLLGGTNDLRFWNWKEKGDYTTYFDDKAVISDIINNIKFMHIKSLANNIEIVLGLVMPIDDENIATDNKMLNILILELNNKIIEYCKNNSIKYIDYYSKFLVAKNNRLNRELAPDGLHPNEKGYKAMTEILFKTLNI